MTRYIKDIKPVNDFTILIDNQEKRPWDLLWDTKVQHLKVGDYTIEGYEDHIAIEKKSGLGELLNDLAASYRPTFKRFLDKMSLHPIRCIVVEQVLSEENVRSAVEIVRKKSRGRSRLTTRTLWYWIGEIQMNYGIPILFVSKRTRRLVLPELFRAACEKAQEMR